MKVVVVLSLLVAWAYSSAVLDVGFEVETHKIRTLSVVSNKEKMSMTPPLQNGNGGHWMLSIDGSRLGGESATKCSPQLAVEAVNPAKRAYGGYLETKSAKSFPSDVVTLKAHWVDYCKAIQTFRDHFDATPYCTKSDIMVDIPANKDLFQMNDVQINVGYKGSMLQNEKAFMDNFRDSVGGNSLIAPVQALIDAEGFTTLNPALQNVFHMWFNIATFLASKGDNWNTIKDGFIVLPKWDFCETLKVATETKPDGQNPLITLEQIRVLTNALGIKAKHDAYANQQNNPWKHFYPFENFGRESRLRNKCSFSSNSFLRAPKFKDGELELLFEYRKIAKSGECKSMIEAVEAETRKQLKAQAVDVDCSKVATAAAASIESCWGVLTAQVPQPPQAVNNEEDLAYVPMGDLANLGVGGPPIREANDGEENDIALEGVAELFAQQPQDFNFKQIPNLKKHMALKKGLLEKN